jgi:glycosyltransferase involved in cell wall biosynthesis
MAAVHPHVSDTGRVPACRAAAPLVTVIVCVFNAGDLLRPSLLSVLDQTYRDLEVIVVDDGSTDGCIDAAADLLADPRLRLIRQANAGKPAALNRALDAMRGEFYAVHDADDISQPHRIEIQVSALLERPHVAAAFCGHDIILGEDRVAPLAAGKSEADCLQSIEAFRQPAHDPTAMYRVSLVRSLRYEETLKCAEGFDYILRVGERHPMLVVGECLYSYRILPNSLTRRDPAWRQQFVEIALRRACERRGLSYDAVFPVRAGTGPRRRGGFRNNNLAAHFIHSVIYQRQRRWPLGAVKTGLVCARLSPLELHSYKALIYALMPTSLVRAIRMRNRRALA